MAIVISVPKFIDLLQQAKKAGAAYASIVSGNRLALGADPMNPNLSIDISREKIEPYRNGKIVNEPHPEPVESKIRRRTGNYWVEVLGRRFDGVTCHEILKAGLLAIDDARPGALEKLSHVKPRTRRIVAREPGMLFENKALVKDHAVKLKDGWWYGTNNSAAETDQWLKRACSIGGLEWERDVKTNLNPTLTIDDLL